MWDVEKAGSMIEEVCHFLWECSWDVVSMYWELLLDWGQSASDMSLLIWCIAYKELLALC